MGMIRMMRNLGGRICDACIRPKRHIRIFENEMSTFPTIKLSHMRKLPDDF